jgi:hypothetical protein
LGGFEKVAGRRISRCHVTKRLDQSRQGIANELIIVNYRDNWLFAQNGAPAF